MPRDVNFDFFSGQPPVTRLSLAGFIQNGLASWEEPIQGRITADFREELPTCHASTSFSIPGRAAHVITCPSFA